MEEIAFFYILIIVGIFASSCSQILLKKSAVKAHKNFISSMMNLKVIIAYVIFFVSLFINITAMSKGVELKNLPILESLGYVFIPLLSFFILKENITKKTILSIVFIILGIIIFYL